MVEPIAAEPGRSRSSSRPRPPTATTGSPRSPTTPGPPVLDDLLGADVPASPGGRARDADRRLRAGSSTSPRVRVLFGVSRAAHYAAAKAGIVGLTTSLAKELGPHGILVNAVAPTQILTVKDGAPSIPDERAAEMAKSIPLRRLATPDDLAAARPLARFRRRTPTSAARRSR